MGGSTARCLCQMYKVAECLIWQSPSRRVERHFPGLNTKSKSAFLSENNNSEH